MGKHEALSDVATVDDAAVGDVDTTGVAFNDYNYRCDKNDAAAQTLWARGELRLRLCYHDTTLNEAALIIDGWGMIEDNRASLLVNAATEASP